ncbi:MAG: DUF2190 domain-containing protein [Burkholderiaceae bacterium]|jgi:hypothetical protein|nr:DUF2190 domain-containing protein [Burkholderiaceae bacterium]
MASQNNPGRQYDKQHAVTIVATATILAGRFVAYDGGYATTTGGVKDAQGVSETDADIGDAFSAITGYSALVETSAAIAFGAYVKPATDSTGRAAVGTISDHCGRALGSASGAGELVEVQIVTHVHA